MVKQPLIVVQAQQQGTHELLFFQVTEAADDAIRRALLFDFLHAGAFAASGRGGRRAWPQSRRDRRPYETICARRLHRELWEKAAPSHFRRFRRPGFLPQMNLLAKRSSSLRRSRSGSLGQRMALFIHQQIEHDENARRRLAQFQNAAGCRMDAHQQVVKRKVSVHGNDDFAIEDEFLGLNGQQRRDQFGKISRQWLARF